jgi:hypothetical protein
LRFRRSGCHKRLKVVLADYPPKPLSIDAVSPANRRYSAKVNAFVNFFKVEFDLDPFVSGYQAWPMQVISAVLRRGASNVSSRAPAQRRRVSRDVCKHDHGRTAI